MPGPLFALWMMPHYMGQHHLAKLCSPTTYKSIIYEFSVWITERSICIKWFSRVISRINIQHDSWGSLPSFLYWWKPTQFNCFGVFILLETKRNVILSRHDKQLKQTKEVCRGTIRTKLNQFGKWGLFISSPHNRRKQNEQRQ